MASGIVPSLLTVRFRIIISVADTSLSYDQQQVVRGCNGGITVLASGVSYFFLIVQLCSPESCLSRYDMSRSDYDPNWACPEVSIYHVPKWHVPKWSCPETSGAP